ncbi:MAG: NFACT RNA binding domain-containing protein [Nanoarchaeota archaeon]
MIDYTKYRWFVTSGKTIVVGGKNATQNDALLKEILASSKDYYVMHTSAPGSPFAVLLKEPARVSSDELEESAIFTACFSQAWKSRKKRAFVDVFQSGQLSKEPSMKTGTWRVRGKTKRISVLLELALIKQRGTLRAVPLKTAVRPLMCIVPGTIDKVDMAAQFGVELGDSFAHDEIVAALPAGGVKKRT